MENKTFKNILFCTDLSEESNSAFEFALYMARQDHGMLNILHVIPDNPNKGVSEGYLSKEGLKKLRETFKNGVNKKFSELYEDKINGDIKFKTVTKSGTPYEEIMLYAEEENSDLIVMGKNSHGGILKKLAGSVTDKVMRESKRPVMLIRSEKTGKLITV
jgi:nucleotide-binding universal stress UspA family protein